jgi:hypothetical protein
MVKLHLKHIQNILEILNEYAATEQIILEEKIKQVEVKSNKKITTDLSVVEFSYLLNKTLSMTCKDFNKRDLARFIVGNFNTSRRDELSEQQVYKAMFGSGKEPEKILREIGIRLMNEGR